MNFEEFDKGINWARTKAKLEEYRETLFDDRRKCLEVLLMVMSEESPYDFLIEEVRSNPAEVVKNIAVIKEIMEDMLVWMLDVAQGEKGKIDGAQSKNSTEINT